MIPGNINTDLISGADEVGYQISRSLRFNSSDSAYLSRTPSSAGNRKKWTWAGWVKRVVIGQAYEYLLDAGVADNFGFTANSAYVYFGSGALAFKQSSAVFRDPGAWLHYLISFDSANSTAEDRCQIWINGVRLTSWSSNPTIPLNFESNINSTSTHTMCHALGYSFMSTYLADIHFIDGQALTPSSFAETNATTGQWVPKAYTGSYGTNGFRLDFSDNSAATATTLGKDRAGSNNWTPNNLSITAGAGNDSLVDTPTSYGTDTGAGGEVRGNYATLNPLDTGGGSFANGNLEWTFLSGTSVNVRGTMAFPVAGKWYFECVSVGAGNQSYGITSANTALTGVPGSRTVMYADNGLKYVDGTGSAYGATYAAGDVVGVAYNADLNQITFYKNNVSQGAISTNAGTTYFPFISGFNSSSILNFGQRPFAYTAPSGFKALCDTNLPAPTIARPSTVFDARLYTGNGSTQTISGLGFSPDLVWGKARSINYFNTVQDTVRGAGKTILYTNSVGAENAFNQDWISSFNSDGFSLASGFYNESPQSYVAWAWDAGSSTVTNTQGSITSQVRANASAGFSIVTWTGNGTAGATVGHGLGAKPFLRIIKRRDAASTIGWMTFHESAPSSYFTLNSTNAATPASEAAPTSSVFSLPADANSNASGGTYVAYCFAPVAGYSSFGSYTGNGSADGPFVYTGFRPRWVLVKSTSTTGWAILDAARNTYNLANSQLFPHASDAELTSPDYFTADFLSNGFKLRTTNSASNTNSQAYIYCAFAESPLQYARAR